MSDRRIEVDRAIAAEPAAIFDVLRSPDGHVSIDASGMLMSAEGEPVGAVDDRFVVHMDRDSLRDFDLGEYDVTVIISAFERDREIAWTIDGNLQPPIGHVYGYRLEPIDGLRVAGAGPRPRFAGPQAAGIDCDHRHIRQTRDGLRTVVRRDAHERVMQPTIEDIAESDRLNERRQRHGDERRRDPKKTRARTSRAAHPRE